MSEPAPSSWLSRQAWYALLPLLAYVVLTQVFRENYPFSHYPMYSKPNSEEIHLQYLADGAGQPLPVAWHTGVTSSKVAKLHANRLKKFKNEKDAAADVLQFLRDANEGRRGRELPPRIQLVETTLAFRKGEVVETKRVLAEDAKPAKS